MAYKKYIDTIDVVNLTGLTRNRILELAKSGILPYHKTRRGHYRFDVSGIEEYFKIQINQPQKETEEKAIEDKMLSSFKTQLILDNHFENVLEQIIKAKSTIKIMTADFKLFKLKSSSNKNLKNFDGTPFIKFLMEKAENERISVQVICASPTAPFKEAYKTLYEQMNPKHFKICFCIRNHAKVVIIDDKIAYIGSANATKAGLGQGVLSKGNFEAGFLTEDSKIISQLNTLFSKIMNGEFCNDCHRYKQCTEY